jgi:hypothetical protein
MMTPRSGRAEYVDVTAAMGEQAFGKKITFNILEGVFE